MRGPMADNPFVLGTTQLDTTKEDAHAHLVTSMQALRASDPLRFAAVLQVLQLTDAEPAPEPAPEPTPEPEPEPAPTGDQPPPGPDAE